MEATVATMARGRLRLRLSPLLMPRLDTIEDTMEAMAMVDTVVAMAATVDTTARGLLMPRLPLMLSLAMVTTAMDTVTATDTTARGLLMLRPSPLLMPSLAMVMDMAATVATTARDLLMLRPSPAMDTMAMDTVMDMAMAATDTAVAMDTTARGPLMLSLAMDTTAVDMVAMDTDAATDTAMAMATTDKKLFVMQFRVQYKN